MTQASAQPRAIRWILIGFPTGLVLTSIIAIYLYFQFQEEAQHRSIRYAAGLRQELTAQGIARHENILQGAAQDLLNGKLTASSYLSSTVGAENMGYETRVLRSNPSPSSPIAALDVELTGSQRPRDLVLVLSDYSDTAAVSKLLALAHDITGESPVRTLRMTFLKDATVLPLYYEKCLAVNERITHLYLCGSMTAVGDAELRKTMHLPEAAAKIQRPELNNTIRPALEQAQSLRTELLDLVSRF